MFILVANICFYIMAMPTYLITLKSLIFIFSWYTLHVCRTLPAGYLEIGESAAEGAVRETLEEACAEVEIISPFAQLDIPHIGQVR